MNKATKIFLALMTIAGSAYSFFWFTTARDVEKMANAHLSMLQNNLSPMGVELYGSVQVQGFPLHFNLVISNFCLALIGKIDYVLEMDGPVALSGQIFGSEYQLILPKKMHVQYYEGSTPHQYNVTLDNTVRFTTQTDLRLIDIWVAHHIHQALPSSMPNWNGFQWILPAGKLALDGKTPLAHWKKQYFNFRTSDLDMKRQQVSLETHLGDIVLEDAFYIEANKWHLPVEGKKSNILDKEIALEADLLAEVPKDRTTHRFNTLVAHANLGNEQWRIKLNADLKTKPLKDLNPTGTGSITLTHPSVFLDRAYQEYINNIAFLDLPAPTFSDNALKAFRTVLDSISKPGEEKDTIILNFARNAQESTKVNDIHIENILAQFHTQQTLLDQAEEARLHRKPLTQAPAAGPAVPLPPPAPKIDPAQLEAEKRQRIQKWVEDHEKNLEQTLKETEPLDKEKEARIQQADVLEQNEKDIQAAIEREKKAQAELKALKEFQKNQKFAKPDA